MAKLIYSAITSLDGYVADKNGNFDWAAPDEELHTFVNDLKRPIGTYLYGRRLLEVMAFWETANTLADQPHFIQDYTKIWQAADKIVYSRTLESVSCAKPRLEREFDPDGVRRMKAQGYVTSLWAVQNSPRRRSKPGWSTSSICSLRRSWWEAAHSPYQTMSA